MLLRIYLELYIQLVYSQHPAIVQSKGFSDPKPLIPAHQEPFRVTDAILPSTPVVRRDFDGDLLAIGIATDTILSARARCP